MPYKSDEWYMNKALSKNLQNVELYSLLYVSATEEEISGSAHEKKTHFEKKTFKDMYCKLNLQMQTDEV